MIKGILFDKDGTLIDFHKLWLTAAYDVMPQFLKWTHLMPESDLEEFLEAIGIVDGEIIESGALAYKCYEGIAQDLCIALQKRGIHKDVNEVKDKIEALFCESVTGKNANYEPTTNLKSLFQQLQKEHIVIGVATADTLESAKTCLRILGIEKDVTFLGADDGCMRPKPAKDMFVAFQKIGNLRPEEIAVVGDTCNDMRFAIENGGVAIGVLSGVGKKKELEDIAHYVIEDISKLPMILSIERGGNVRGKHTIKACI